MPEIGWREVLAWAFRCRRRVRIEGRSMAPLLLPGDELLIAPKRALRVGDLACFRHPFRGDLELVKRVTAIGPDGATLMGLNPAESTDSRSYGPVPKTLYRGRVTCRLPRTR